jgi:hypothetical protein
VAIVRPIRRHGLKGPTVFAMNRSSYFVSLQTLGV